MVLKQTNNMIQNFKREIIKMISIIIVILMIGPSNLLGQVNLLNPRFEFSPDVRYDQLVSSPKDYLGYELGTEYTIYADVLSYLRKLGEESERVSIHPYGKTHEGRVLEYLIITSDKNRNRLDTIQKNNLRLADPRNINTNTAKKIGKLISTNYYQTEFSRDVNGVEFLSAIKNIYSMIIGSGQWHNTSSALFRKSIDEMKYLANYFKGKKETVYGLAGLGDLYVSAMGGRNSKMGEYLGKGYTFTRAKKKFMKNDTVEGADLAIEIAPFVFKKINKRKVPLMISLLEAIVKNKKLKIKY